MDTRIFFILMIFFGLWLGVLTSYIYKIYKLFSSLKGSIELDLEKKGFAEVKKRLEYLEKDGLKHSQKISLIRFNPFKELGGDHSFSLAILDGEDTGVIITSLHTRDRTRVYMKNIENGKSKLELSSEEKQALKKAIT